MSKTGGDAVFHIYCAHHGCDLEENEHYEDWFFSADTSGFSCPRLPDDASDEEADKCSNSWRVSPVGRDDIDVWDLIKKVSE